MSATAAMATNGQRRVLCGLTTLRTRKLSPVLKSHCAPNSTLPSLPARPLKSILIANRGEIAIRVGQTAAQYGIRITTLYTDPDRISQHALSSPFNANLGSTDQYLNGQRIIEVAKQQGCDAIHPGYGFLSENAAFAKACTDAGVKFIGPPWKSIEAMGDKSRSKDIMTKAAVPCIPGYHGANQDPAYLEEEAGKIGYPVLLKAVKGGGGKGMRIVNTREEFAQQLQSAKSEARSSFADDVMLVEKYIKTPRHIEVQVFADTHGNCVALGERDCSIQRRHQKILEESPAPNLPDAVRKDLWETACQAALAVGYEGAGTVEFIFDNNSGDFFFMEMNTRLQVEHPVTEMVTGEDLVRWQIIVAEGGKLPLTQSEIEQRICANGHAIEARIYAEDPDQKFLPSTGRLLHLRTPTETSSVRIDAGFEEGDEVSSHYDPMIAKLIVSGPDRATALQKMAAALEQYEIAGPITNVDFVRRVCQSPEFVSGQVETGYIQKHHQELFEQAAVPLEAWVQAALGLYKAEQAHRVRPGALHLPRHAIGFGAPLQPREFHLVQEKSEADRTAEPMVVSVLQHTPDSFHVNICDQTLHVTSSYEGETSVITSFFPHTRISTTMVRDPETNQLTLFQQGRQYRLKLTLPNWTKQVLREKDVTNSVLAPMPCKILKVEVTEGQKVVKNQALVLIESMKMETVIRSPQGGKISRIIHRTGDICKAGTALVEFEINTGD